MNEGIATEPAAFLEAERNRCAIIAEAVNDSIKLKGKFAAHILNPNTCIVPTSGGGVALQAEHVIDNEGRCVYCSEVPQTGFIRYYVCVAYSRRFASTERSKMCTCGGRLKQE